jgi:SH3-like domain-containing protein
MGEGEFRPTHEVPLGGIATWSAPDPSRQADNRIEGGVPVQVLTEATGWAHVRCSNGWEAWVDVLALGPMLPSARPPMFTVPSSGLEARGQPGADQPVVARLDPGLPVERIEEWGEWAKVRCSNGWECWVDGRPLVPTGQGPAAGPRPAAAARSGARLTGGAWLTMAGGALAALSGLLPWFSAGGFDSDAWDVEFVSLFTLEDSDLSLKTGLVLLVGLVALIPLVTQRPLPPPAALGVGALVTLIGVLGFRALYDIPEPRPDIGFGLILTVVSGVLVIVGALMRPSN